MRIQIHIILRNIIIGINCALKTQNFGGTHGHGQHYADCRGDGGGGRRGYKGINVNRKKFNKKSNTPPQTFQWFQYLMHLIRS